MQFEAHPVIIDEIFFFQPVDKALADIAEGSNVIGKYFEVDDHSCLEKLDLI